MKQKFTYILLSLLLLAPITASAKRIYCQMEHSWWTTSNASIKIHYWGGSSSTIFPGILMNRIEDGSTIWYADIPDDATGCIFSRHSADGTADWNARTKDQAIPTNGFNMCYITNTEQLWYDNNDDKKCSTVWKTFYPSFTFNCYCPSFTPYIWAWDVGNTNTNFTGGSWAGYAMDPITDKTGWYSKTFTNIICTGDLGILVSNNGSNQTSDLKITGYSSGGDYYYKTDYKTDGDSYTLAEYVHVSSINIDPITVAEGSTTKLTANVQPNNAYNKEVTWSSDNQNVTVDAAGNVTIGTFEGDETVTATITATSKDNGTTGTCTITIKPRYTFTFLFWSKWTSVKNYIFNALDNTKNNDWPGTTTGIEDKQAELGDGWFEITITDLDAGAKFVLTDGNNENNKTVDLPVDTYKTQGNERFTLGALSDGKYAFEKFKPTTKLHFDLEGNTISLLPSTNSSSTSQVLTVEEGDIDGHNQGVIWKSSNSDVASVSYSGDGKTCTINPGATTGTVTITATSKDNPSLTATCTVIVANTYTFTIRFWNNPNIENWQTVREGDTYPSVYVHIWDAGTGKGTEWPGDPIEQDADGWIEYEFKDLEGTAKFIFGNGKDGGGSNQTKDLLVAENNVSGDYTLGDKIISNDPSINNRYTLTKFIHTTSVTLSATAQELVQDQTVTLTATVDGTDTRIRAWKSNSEAVATVTAEGVVTAVGEGTANITATSVDNNIESATPCAITVYPGKDGLTISHSSPMTELGLQGDGTKASPYILYKNKEFTFSASVSQKLESLDTKYLHLKYGSTEAKATNANYTFTPTAADEVVQALVVEAYNKIGDAEGTHAKHEIWYRVKEQPSLALKAPKEMPTGSQLYFEVVTNATLNSPTEECFKFFTKFDNQEYKEWPKDEENNNTGKEWTHQYYFRNNYGAGDQPGTHTAYVAMNYGGYIWTSKPIEVKCVDENQAWPSTYTAYVGYPFTLGPTLDGTYTWTIAGENPATIVASTHNLLVPTAAGTATAKVVVTGQVGNTNETTNILSPTTPTTITVIDPAEVFPDKQTILVRVNVAKVTSDTEWNNQPQIHYWWDGEFDTYTNCVSDGDGWWKAIVPLSSVGMVNIQFYRGSGNNTGDYTRVLGEQTTDCCWEVQDGFVSNETGDNGKRDVNLVNDCDLHYRVESQTSAEVFYSNEVTRVGEIFSYYAANPANSKHLTLQHHNDVEWEDILALTPPETSAAGGVYTASISTSNTITQTPYNGDYYIRTHRAEGQTTDWKEYKEMTTAERDHAQFTYFAPAQGFTDLYNYYWVEWYDDKTTKSVKAQVANEYNKAITNVLIDDGKGTTTGTGNEFLPTIANVRFGYNPETNALTRAIIGGSQDNGRVGFMTIYDKDSKGGRLYSLTKGENGEVTETPITSDAPATFRDISNWCYEVDVNAKPGAAAVMEATFNGVHQYLFGQENDGTLKEKVLLGERTTQLTDGAAYGLRVIYDFKTNRLTAGWVPSGNEITDNLRIEANMLVVRTENGNATNVSVSPGTEVNGLKQIVTVMEFNESSYTNDMADDKYVYFWISLPYDCKISSIFGLNNYGSTSNDTWVIQRYRGDKRAELGLFYETPTFWYNMKNNKTATMEANRGYVLRLNKNKMEFIDIDVYVPAQGVEGQDGYVEARIETKKVLRLYFPSEEVGFTLSENGTVTTEVPLHERTVERRKEEDSNWNVIGVPGFEPMHITGWKSNLESQIAPSAEPKEGENFFYYKYDWKVNDKIVKQYTPAVANAGSEAFKPTYAYMVQFGGTINWEQATAVQHALKPAMRAKENADAPKLLTLNVANAAGSSDNTFVQLINGATTDYDLNMDLGKIVNSGVPQVYSLGKTYTVNDGRNETEQVRFAANNLPIESQSVALGIQAPTAGEYTFSMASVPAGVIPTLLDTKTGATVNLSFDTYTVTLEQGTDEKRFILQLNIQNTPTGNECLTANGEWRITQVGNEFLISGLTEPADVRLYDALGRILYQGLIMHETIPVTQQGVYLVQVNGQTQRVLVK